MSRSTRSPHHRPVPRRPRLERLHSLTMPSFVVVAVDPIPGADLTTPPPALTVTFDGPIDATSLCLGDIRLDEVDDSGGLTPLDATESPGPSADQLVLTPTRPLTPGQYQISLVGGSGLLSTAGEGLVGDGTDQSLGDFRVVAQGAGLGDALDLGTPGPTPASISGSLDFLANPSDVRLYKITLPVGHFWRLGLEVSAEREGGTLDSALALFDDEGRPIATDETGRKDAPFDPFLFAGLQPGTYYVGVSGTGNLAGSPGGYDPATRSAGTFPQSQVGGPFRLDIVADPEDSPPQLVSFNVDRADPLDPQPTGLTLGLSAAIRGDSPLGGTAGAIEVVDQNGRAWPLAISNYSESEARISYLFRERLPEGSYTVRLPAQGGLVDLAGLSPVAPGQPAGVLGTFMVGPSQARADPSDLGALLPDAALGGVTLDVVMAPGESVSCRVVITFDAIYTFQGRYSGGALAISRIGPEGASSLDPGAPGAISGTNDSELQPGLYLIQLRAIGAEPVAAQFLLKAATLSQEQILLNGVGQGPALSLRLIHPPVMDPAPPVISTSEAPPGDQSGSTLPSGRVPATGTTPLSGLTPPPAFPLPGASSESSLASTPFPGPSSLPLPPSLMAGSIGDHPSPSTDSPPGGGAGRDPVLSSARTAPQVPAVIYLGVGGDFIGRPSPLGPIATSPLWATSAGGNALDLDAAGSRRRIATVPATIGNRPLYGSTPLGGIGEEERFDPATMAAAAATITDLGLVHRDGEHPTRPASTPMDRLRETIVDMLEHGLHDVSSVDTITVPPNGSPPAAAGKSGQVSDRAEHAPDVITPAQIALATALVFQFRRQIIRTLGRLRGLNPARHLVRQLTRRTGLPASPRPRLEMGTIPDTHAIDIKVVIMIDHI
jgi:hypothetical protein